MVVWCSTKQPYGLERSAVRAMAVPSTTVRQPQPSSHTASQEARVNVPVDVNIRKEVKPYFVLPREYDARCVGPSAMALSEPEWTIPRSANVEKSISFVKGSMFKMLAESYDNASAFRLVQALMSPKRMAGNTPARHLKRNGTDQASAARDALRKLKLPQSFIDQFVDACVRAGIPVPITRDEWEALRKEVAAAFMAMLANMVFQDKQVADEEFGQHASILFRDRSTRAYTFTATTDSCRRVYVEVGMPQCEGQGIGAVCGRAALDSPRTVHHPQRACAVGGGAKLVELDVPQKMQIPRQIAMHHREGDGWPAAVRTSFEGDNMLLVPPFRRHVFSSIAKLALEMMESRAWESMADSRVSVPEAAEIRGYVNPDLGLVVSSIHEAKIDISSKPWSLESRF